MYTQLRKSGIEVLGDIPWGSHFCQFYETKKDLLELLVPYFKAGLESNEYCLWVTCDPISVEEACTAMKDAVIDFDWYLNNKSIEIFPCRDWYVREGRFNEKLVSRAWIEKLQDAMRRGYDGMRVNSNETWLNPNDRHQFMEYERSINSWLQNLRMIIFCTYPLKQTSGGFFSEVAHAHECVISRQKDRWEILETPALRMKKAELVEQNKQLDALVAERTSEWEKEIEERGKAEAKFKTIVEQSLVGFFIIHNGKFVYVNPQLAKIFGYTQDELIDSYPEAVIHPDDRERVIENVRIHMEGEIETLHYEAKGLKKSGKGIWIEVFCNGTLGEKTKEIMGTILDITERKKAEEQLMYEKDLSSSIIESIPGIFELYDRQFRFLRWNKQFEVTSGYTPEEIRNLHVVDDLTFGGQRRKRYNILKRIYETGRDEGEITITVKNGKEIPLYYVGQLINYEGEACYICSAVDITERKRIEEDLKSSELRYRTLVEQASDAIIIIDEIGNLVEVNTSFCKMVGYSEKELLGMNMTELTDPDQLKNDPLRIDLLLAGKTFFGERRMKKKDATIFDVEANVQTLPDKRILAIVRDITDRKKAEEKLNTSYEQIRSLSEYLTNVREEERKHIAREIHDELGQELTVLKMDVGSLVKKLPLADDIIRKRLASFSELIDNIAQSVRRIASELRPSLLDDVGLPAAIAWHMEEFEKRSGIKVHFTEPKDEWILPDPVKINLFRIVQEATTNIGRHSKATEVDVNLERNDHWIALRLFDNGVGFNSEAVCKGNTLGILGMRERASIIGGKLAVKTAPGIGTEIVVSVPLPLGTK
jgi:PAS domain S-box-containing protein